MVKTYKKYKDRHKIIDNIEYKQCYDCENWFPMNEENFKVQPSKKDGFGERCLECQKIYNHNTYMKNRDVNLEKSKQRQKELYAIRVGQKRRAATYQKHKDKTDQKKREWIQNNFEKRKAWLREHRIKHPEQFREYGKKRQEKKHIINDIEWNNCKKYFNYECVYCGLPMEEHFMERNGKIYNYDLHKEHVIDDGKNDLRNCIPSCNDCNKIKHQKTLNEFYNPNNPNYTYERYHKIYMWMKYDHKKFIMPKRRYKNQRLSARLKEIENNKNQHENER